ARQLALLRPRRHGRGLAQDRIDDAEQLVGVAVHERAAQTRATQRVTIARRMSGEQHQRLVGDQPTRRHVELAALLIAPAVQRREYGVAILAKLSRALELPHALELELVGVRGSLGHAAVGELALLVE